MQRSDNYVYGIRMKPNNRGLGDIKFLQKNTFWSWYLSSRKRNQSKKQTTFEWNTRAAVKRFWVRISNYNFYSSTEISLLCWLPLAGHLLFCLLKCLSGILSGFLLCMSTGKANYLPCVCRALCTERCSCDWSLVKRNVEALSVDNSTVKLSGKPWSCRGLGLFFFFLYTQLIGHKVTTCYPHINVVL